ncbi:yippee-domain-containing protein [Panus rudis PR-1116 ss-1]|nr:yippee-domain-containing protein [Panus rudis PR-1116 ss-1]
MTRILIPKHSVSHLTEGNGRPQGALACRTCKSRIASKKAILSWSFRGWNGRAALFRSAFELQPPILQLMDTGAHTVQEVSCKTCGTKLGWKIVRAYEWPEKWKEGNIILELSLLEDNAGSPLKQELKPMWPERNGSVQNLGVALESSSHRRTISDVSDNRAKPPGSRTQSMHEGGSHLA